MPGPAAPREASQARHARPATVSKAARERQTRADPTRLAFSPERNRRGDRRRRQGRDGRPPTALLFDESGTFARGLVGDSRGSNHAEVPVALVLFSEWFCQWGGRDPVGNLV